MSTRDEYVEKFKHQLDEWNGSIDALASRAGKARDDVKAGYDDHVSTLREHQAAVVQRVQDIQAASEGSWHDLRDGLESAKGTLSESLKKARAHFG
jgi:uncharacterized membrane-anchored protein YjiN (DUF445 family)